MSKLINRLKHKWNDWRNPFVVPEEIAQTESVELKTTFDKIPAPPVPSHGDTPLTNIKGVGPKMAATLQLHGIYTVEQLVVYEDDELHMKTGIGLHTCDRLISKGLRLIT